MNITHLEHTVIALLICIIAALLSGGNWLFGAGCGAFFFIGREHNQAEAKARKAGHKRPDMVVLYNWRYWTLDGVLDFVFPALAVTALIFVKDYVL